MAGVWLVELLWVCWVCSGYLVGFILFFLFWVFGSGFWRLGRIWVAFGLALDLGPVVVIFPMGWGICSDGFDGGFRCLLGLFGQRVVVASHNLRRRERKNSEKHPEE